MQQPSVIHSTFVLERKYPKPPERVFAAFSDPNQKRRWFGESDSHELERFDIDFRVGGEEHFDYRLNANTPFPGVTLSNEGVYQDIVPGHRLVVATKMTLGDKRISASLLTFEFLAEPDGTALICTHQGAFFEGSDGPEMREGGWRLLLDRMGAELARQ